MSKLKRDDLQGLARMRLEEAALLLNAQFFSGAYYLTGLALECALKACIARSTEEFEFPDLNHVKESWHHDLFWLLNTAGVKGDLDKRSAAEPQFEANWLTVRDWN